MEMHEALSLPDPTSDIEAGIRNIAKYGVTIHRDFIKRDFMNVLRDRLTEQAEMEIESGVATYDPGGTDTEKNFSGDNYKLRIGKPKGTPSIQSVTFLVNKGRCFIDLGKHPIALAYAEHVLKGSRFNISGQIGFITRNGASAQHLHADQQYMPFETPIPLSISVMVALGEYEEDMGATRIVPGSHRWPPPEIGTSSDVHTLPIVMEPGSAAIWESRVWHGRGASTSSKARLAVFTEYIRNFIKPLNYHPASIHDDVYDQMNDEERSLYDFGYFLYAGNIAPRSQTDSRQNVDNYIPYIPELKRGSHHSTAT